MTNEEKLCSVQYEAPHFIYREAVWHPYGVSAGVEDTVANVVWVTSAQEELAGRAVAAGKLVVWDLQLDLAAPLALSQQRVQEWYQGHYERWRASTFGINLWSGTIDSLGCEERCWLPADHWTAWCQAAHVPLDATVRPHYGVALLDLWAGEVTAGIPEEPLRLACVDTRGCGDALAFYQLSQRARYDQLHIFWRPPIAEAMVDYAWEEGIPLEGYLANQPLASGEASATALCLPPAWCFEAGSWEALRLPMQEMASSAISYRPVAEEFLSLLWCDVDTIIVVSTALSAVARRQLMGFGATGGTIATIGPPLGVSGEMSFEQWLSQYQDKE